MKIKSSIILSIIIFLVFYTTSVAYSENNNLKNSSSVSNSIEDANIIFYASHPESIVGTGEKITNFMNLLQQSFNKNGIKSFVLDNDNKIFIESYKCSRNTIIKDVKDYQNKILLDLHGYSNKVTNLKYDITIHIGKSNNNYKQNLLLGEALIKEINKYDSSISCNLFVDEGARYNQDLSSRSLLIEVGNKQTSSDRLDKIISVITHSFTELQ